MHTIIHNFVSPITLLLYHVYHLTNYSTISQFYYVHVATCNIWMLKLSLSVNFRTMNYYGTL